MTIASCAEAVIRAQDLGRQKHLDWGGGNGLLTRLLRDRGIDMRHHDPYAVNLFAPGFEGHPDDEYGCVTLIEVLEHLLDPLHVIRSLSERAQLILISTLLAPKGADDITDWWYLIPHLGQHITFFTEPALRAIAEECGLTLTSDGVGLHVLSREPLRPLARLVIRKHRAAAPVAALARRRQHAVSLTEADFAVMRQRVAILAAERDRAGSRRAD
jgi:hypothetical protein